MYSICPFFSNEKNILEQINDLLESFIKTGMSELEFSTTTNSQLFNYSLFESQWRNLYNKYTDLKSGLNIIETHMEELINDIINELKKNNLKLNSNLKIQIGKTTESIKSNSNIYETLFNTIYSILSQEPHIEALVFIDEEEKKTTINLTKGDKKIISLKSIETPKVKEAEINCINHIGHIFSLPKMSSNQFSHIIHASKHRIRIRAI